MAKTVILFPGQGAQHVGMGKDVAEAHPAAGAVFAQANDVLGFDLAELCFNGPVERLNATDISQPAIFAASVAIWKALEATGAAASLSPEASAGLSLGEYTALWLGGSLSFADGLRLVRRRGELMQAASEMSPSSMVSIIGLDEPAVQDLCKQASEAGVMVPANFNCPGQIVVSGAKAACERIVELVEQGDGRAVPLTVAGAFHSPLMQPAADGLRAVLGGTDVTVSRFPVALNVSGGYHDGDADSIRQGLYEQVVQPVRWQRNIERLLADGYDRFVEVGPGRVLTGLMRKISRRTETINVSTAEAVAKLSDR